MKRSGPLTRRTPLRNGALRPGPGPKRSAPMKRGKRLNPVNRARRTTAFARAYGSAERVRFVKGLRCSVPGCPSRQIENAHAAAGGMGYKADASTVAPLCTGHHAEQHAVGTRAFERRHGIDLARAAAETEAAWQNHLASGGGR